MNFKAVREPHGKSLTQQTTAFSCDFLNQFSIVLSTTYIIGFSSFASPKWAQEAIQLALQAVEDGMSQRPATQNTDILNEQPRITGSVSVKQGVLDQQVISETQGRHLASWAQIQEGLGTALTHY